MLRKEDTDWVKKCMEYEVKGCKPWQEVNQRGLGERLCKKIVKHVNSPGRMLWIVVDGICEWVNVSSGIGSPG